MNIKTHFFGRECQIDKELCNHASLEAGLQEQNINFSNIVFVNQVHGRDVIVIDHQNKIHGKQGLPKADALVTNIPNLILAVITADCAPILLQDNQAGIIAAIHAGWRGAKVGVINSTITEMKKLGAKTENIAAAIGPMIHQESYQVSEEFFDDFMQENSANKKFFINDVEPRKHLFNLPFYVTEKLQKEGIKTIQNSTKNTYKNFEHYASFRKSTHLGEKDCGRNVSVIGIN